MATLRDVRSWTAGPILTGAIASAVAAAVGAGQVPRTGCDDLWPAWSPDGTRIVFASTRTGDPEIYLRTIGQPDVARLTSVPGRDAHPSFSPDGRTIVFQSPREPAGHTNLYAMNVDGTNVRRLTTHTGFAGMPVWSPDGRFIAYQWTPALSAANWRLMLLRATAPGAPPRQITNGAANDQVVNWAPDSRRVVFHSDRTGVNQLFTMALDGDPVRITGAPAPSQSGAWSPDGRWIAFKSDRGGVASAVYVMKPDGAEVRRVGSLSGEHGVPFFSPDGGRLLVQRRGATGSEIVALRIADGTEELLSACAASPDGGRVFPGFPIVAPAM
jgi:Tol biopolymer transport system component